MLKEKSELTKLLKELSWVHLFNTDDVDYLSVYAHKKHDLPTGTTIGLMSGQQELDKASDFELFCLLEAYDSMLKKTKVKDFFTEREIKTYCNQKYVNPYNLEMPIRIKMLPLPMRADQWIGVTDARFLMKLYESNKIVYNPNAQRVMKKITLNGEEAYQIDLNKRSVKEMSELFENGQYISDEITLNIPLDDETVSFYYNEEDCELVIEQIDHFDISDGFHRYYTLCQKMSNDETFNYPMELRITMFPDEKVKQYIWQKEQKNRMTKVQQKSFNTYNLANSITDIINSQPNSLLYQTLKTRGESVTYNQFSDLVDYYFVSGSDKSEYTKIRIRAVSEIQNKFEILLSEAPQKASLHYTFIHIAIAFCVLFGSDTPEDEYVEKIRHSYNRVMQEINPKMYRSGQVTNKLMNTISAIVNS